jgi:hypothetical protein
MSLQGRILLRMCPTLENLRLREWDEQRLLDRANIVAERRPAQQARHQREVIVEDIRRIFKSIMSVTGTIGSGSQAVDIVRGVNRTSPILFTLATIVMLMPVRHVVFSGFDARVLCMAIELQLRPH